MSESKQEAIAAYLIACISTVKPAGFEHGRCYFRRLVSKSHRVIGDPPVRTPR